MATKKNLYQLLQVPRNATPDIVKAAYESRVQALGTSAAPEAMNERSLLKQACDILSDPARRKLYDAKLIEEAARNAASGGDALAASQPVMKQRAKSTVVPASVVWIIVIAFLGIAGAGVWIYFDHKRNALLAKQLREKQAEEDQQRLEALLDDPQRIDWGKTPYDPNRGRVDARYEASYRNYESARYQYEQNRLARQQAYEAQRAAMQQRQVEYARQREEQENLRRQQLQLERERRHLRELESQRPQRF
jgi:curved DNA-binding protein CbpA